MGDNTDDAVQDSRQGNTGQVVCRFLAGCFMSLTLCWGGICVLLYIELKALFRLSQVEVEILAGVHMMGVYFALPYSLLHRRFGFHATFLTGWMAVSCGYLLQALAAFVPMSFLGTPLLLYFCMFLYSNGRCGILFLMVLTAMNSTPKAHSGKAVSCTVATMYFGFSILGPVYKSYFANITKTPLYFLVSFGVFAVYSVLYLIVYALTTASETKEDENAPGKSSQDIIKVEEQKHLLKNCLDEGKALDKEPGSTLNSDTVTYKEMLFSYRFHLYLWSGGSILATNMLSFTNSCLLLQSLGMERYQTNLIITMMVTVITSHLVMGSAYDILKTVSSKVYLLMIAASLNIVSFAIMLIYMKSVYMVFISAVFMSFTVGGGLSVYLNFSANIFGMKNVGIVQGILMTCYEMFGLTLCLIIGFAYDYFADTQVSQDSHMCHGKQCFWWSWLVMFCIALVASVLPVLLQRHYRQIEAERTRL